MNGFIPFHPIITPVCNELRLIVAIPLPSEALSFSVSGEAVRGCGCVRVWVWMWVGDSLAVPSLICLEEPQFSGCRLTSLWKSGWFVPNKGFGYCFDRCNCIQWGLHLYVCVYGWMDVLCINVCVFVNICMRHSGFGFVVYLLIPVINNFLPLNTDNCTMLNIAVWLITLIGHQTANPEPASSP